MEASMMIIRWVAAFAFVLSLMGLAHAGDDVAYCQALAAKYQAHLVKTTGHNPNPGTADGNVAAYQCSQGNVAGIPVLERKLRDAGYDLPARG
jgi:hypothetical protein